MKFCDKNNDLIRCENCIFNDQKCEEMFDECVTNFIDDPADEEHLLCHLKYANIDEFGKLNDNEQEEFINTVLEINEQMKNVKTNVG